MVGTGTGEKKIELTSKKERRLAVRGPASERNYHELVQYLRSIKKHDSCLDFRTLPADGNERKKSLFTVQSQIEFEIQVAVSSFHTLSRLSNLRESTGNVETITRITNLNLQKWKRTVLSSLLLETPASPCKSVRISVIFSLILELKFSSIC